MMEIPDEVECASLRYDIMLEAQRLRWLRQKASAIADGTAEKSAEEGLASD
jgi:hypothetical protein